MPFFCIIWMNIDFHFSFYFIISFVLVCLNEVNGNEIKIHQYWCDWFHWTFVLCSIPLLLFSCPFIIIITIIIATSTMTMIIMFIIIIISMFIIFISMMMMMMWMIMMMMRMFIFITFSMSMSMTMIMLIRISSYMMMISLRTISIRTIMTRCK